MTTLAIITYLLAVSGPSQAPSQQEIDAVLALCEEIHCYPPSKLTVATGNGEVQEFELAYPIPVVQPNGWVVAFPGTTAYITGRVDDGRLIELASVAEAPEDDYIRIEMFQKDGEPDTYLKVANFFKHTIKYRAGYMPPDRDGLYSTSSCPLMPNGLFAFEHWPYPIFQIVMADFHVLDEESDSLVCE